MLYIALLLLLPSYSIRSDSLQNSDSQEQLFDLASTHQFTESENLLAQNVLKSLSAYESKNSLERRDSVTVPTEQFRLLTDKIVALNGKLAEDQQAFGKKRHDSIVTTGSTGSLTEAASKPALLWEEKNKAVGVQNLPNGDLMSLPSPLVIQEDNASVVISSCSSQKVEVNKSLASLTVRRCTSLALYINAPVNELHILESAETEINAKANVKATLIENSERTALHFGDNAHYGPVQTSASKGTTVCLPEACNMIPPNKDGRVFTATLSSDGQYLEIA